MKRAYKTTVGGIESVVSATSPAQARAKTMRGFQDAGFNWTWNEIRVRRYPKLDAWAAADESRHCWSEAYLGLTGQVEAKQ